MVSRSLLLKKNEGLLNAVTVFAASAISMCFVFKVFGDTNGFVYLWPLTGVQLGLLLPKWASNRTRWAGQAGGILGVFAGGWAMGLQHGFGAFVAGLSGMDVWIAGAILSQGVIGFEDLKWRKNLLLFAVAAIVAPIVAGCISGTFVALMLHERVFRSTVISILSDSLGIVVILPVVLFLLTGKYRNPRTLVPHLRRGLPAAALFVAVATGIFWQTSNPLLFMVFPAMVLVLMVLGLEGAVFVSASLAIIGCYATAHGHGPLWLTHSATSVHRLMVLQLFLWLSAATVLPLGALLDEHRRTEETADEATMVYQTLLENADDMIVLSSIDGKHRYMSAATERMTGWTPAEFLAMDRLSTFHPDDRDIADLVIESMIAGKREHTFRYRLAQRDGGYRWVQATARAYFDGETGKVRGYVGTVRDISAFKLKEEGWSSEREELAVEKQRVERLARTDALTQLPNRRAFDEAIEEQVLSLRHGGKAALMMVDIDFFKQYNDLYGHYAGDKCLQRIAAALQEKASRTQDLVTRWGGEEFGVLLPGADAMGADIVANAMLDRVRRLAIEHKGNPLGIVTISIGIAGLEGYSEGVSNLWVQRADKALYLSKRAGKNRATVGRDSPADGAVAQA